MKKKKSQIQLLSKGPLQFNKKIKNKKIKKRDEVRIRRRAFYWDQHVARTTLVVMQTRSLKARGTY